MNSKLILFSASITAAVGCILGVVATEIASPQYKSQFYRNLKNQYTLIGAGLGFVIGAGQESIRQLKKEQSSQTENHQKY
jgi:hypothetical protein